MSETEQSIAQTIADFYGERCISFEHRELARLIFQIYINGLEKEANWLYEELKYLSDPDA